jgi:hypothetical protein
MTRNGASLRQNDLERMSVFKPGDQIGRIFAYLVVVYFLQFFYITEVLNFWQFFTLKKYVYFL